MKKIKVNKNKILDKNSDKQTNDSKDNKNNNLSTKRHEIKSKISKKSKTNCNYPKDSKDFSANWKRLALKLNSNKTNDKKLIKNKSFETNKTKQKKVIEKKSTKSEIWFDGVDDCLIKSSMIDINCSDDKNEKLVKDKSFSGLTKVLAMDCEMVGTGSDGMNSVLARVSIVNFFGHCIYDKYVKPIEEITDYRTAVSGIRPSDLVNASDFKIVQKEVNDLLKDRLLVGHALKNDFKVLFLSHPKHKIRDTSKYFKRLFGGRPPSLKRLSETVLGVKVQSGEHDSVEDARAAMRLFTMFRRKWESDINRKFNKNKISKKHKSIDKHK
jgi:RNA exonuclease 4